jgi:hypothetical protein
VLAQVRDPEQQVRLARLARSKNAFDVLLPLCGLACMQQRRSEQKRVREIAGEHRLAWLQQRDHLLVFAGLQVAIREKQVRTAGFGIRREHAFQLRDRQLRPRRFVVRERQVQAHGIAGRVVLQRLFVLPDRIVELSEPDVRGAEV